MSLSLCMKLITADRQQSPSGVIHASIPCAPSGCLKHRSRLTSPALLFQSSQQPGPYHGYMIRKNTQDLDPSNLATARGLLATILFHLQTHTSHVGPALMELTVGLWRQIWKHTKLRT